MLSRLKYVPVFALAALLVVYVGSYVHLSRRGVAEAAEYGMEGFLYVPADQVFATKDLSQHYFFCKVYAPINWVDRALFGGPDPVRGITFDLSG